MTTLPCAAETGVGSRTPRAFFQTTDGRGGGGPSHGRAAWDPEVSSRLPRSCDSICWKGPLALPVLVENVEAVILRNPVVRAPF